MDVQEIGHAWVAEIALYDPHLRAYPIAFRRQLQLCGCASQ
jgi:hypothetical protein